MDYSLKKLDSTSVTLLKDRWISQLEEIIQNTGASWMVSSFERIFDWCEKQSNASSSECIYILESKSGDYRAVAEITDASKSKDPALKFLNVYLEPNLNTEWMETIDRDTAMETANVLASAIINAAKLAHESGTNKLKVYGRTDEMMGMFDAILTMNGNNRVNGLKLYKQSRWLIIEMEG